MRYLLLDRILRLERHTEIVAIKNVTLSEDIYNEHFPGFPVMPGALLIECLAQAGTALLEVSNNYQKKALLILVDQAKFRAMVRPGDQLLIKGKLISNGEDSAQMDGTAGIGDKIVMSGRLTFGLKNAEEFYTPKTRFLVESMYDVWLKGAELLGFEDL